MIVPPDYSSDNIVIPISISDDKFNEWKDSITFTVTPFERTYAATQTLTGSKLDGSFQIIITNSAVIKNHTYVIQGIDSIDAQRTTGFTLKDETDNRVVLANSPLPDIYNHNLQPTEGFKILRGNIETLPAARSCEFTTNTWFNPTPSHPRVYMQNMLGSDSTALVPKGGYHKVVIYFAPVLGIVDTNGNSSWNYGEKILFDTTNYGTTQKGFMLYKYSIFKSAGFGWLPFTAFDVESGTQRKLNIVVNDLNKNLRWDPKEPLYVMSTSYDSTGAIYNSAGGIDLFALPFTLEKNALSRAYWIVQFDTVLNSTPYSSYAPMTLTPAYPLSSANGFTFNPTVVLGVPSESEIPKEFSLAQNYPNPFNPETVISYELPIISSVKLVIYDLLGREVATLVNEEQSAGRKQVQWSASVSSGVYFYRLEAIARGGTARQFTQVRKMLLLR